MNRYVNNIVFGTHFAKYPTFKFTHCFIDGHEKIILKGIDMSTKLDRASVSHTDVFSIATLLYARLRRVSGRVIDVMYLVENPSYARQMAELALSTEDAELIRLVSRLDSAMDLFNYEDAQLTTSNAKTESRPYESEATEEEIYRAQVSHHYIGALR